MNNEVKINESWTKWIPIANLAKKYYIKEILDSIDEGFKVKLLENGNQEKGVTIFFDESVWIYKYTDESFRQYTVAKLNAQYGVDFYAKWTFFKIENSDYLKWISEESYGMYDNLEWRHFCILTDNEILDIIAVYEPEVTLSNQPSVNPKLVECNK